MAVNQMTVFGLDLLDMNAVILSIPEGSRFLLGSISVAAVKTYFPKDIPTFHQYIQLFEIWGSVLVLPLTPEKALCIYDSETYTVDGVVYDICKITKENVDTLNSAQVYNSNDSGGVIHISGEDYIDKLYEKLDDEDCLREVPFHSAFEEYPFDIKLSVLKVKKESRRKTIREKKINSQGIYRQSIRL